MDLEDYDDDELLDEICDRGISSYFRDVGVKYFSADELLDEIRDRGIYTFELTPQDCEYIMSLFPIDTIKPGSPEYFVYEKINHIRKTAGY